MIDRSAASAPTIPTHPSQLGIAADRMNAIETETIITASPAPPAAWIIHEASSAAWMTSG